MPLFLTTNQSLVSAKTAASHCVKQNTQKSKIIKQMSMVVY